MTELLTLTRARALLARHGLAARRSLGQHFLVDPNTVRKIVRLSGVGPGDTVLEVGPGLGSLTLGLAQAAGRVVAVELDAKVADVLREVVPPSVEVVVADALRADLGSLVAGPALLVANLPYNVATPIMARVLDEVTEIRGGLVMVQRELGERWTSPPGSRAYGAISVKFAYHASAEVAAAVPRTVFLPPPKVASVLVRFERLAHPAVEVDDPRAFFATVSAAFGHRRKTMLNALTASGLDRERVREALAEAGIDPQDRPERLDVHRLADLHRALGR
ncbi:MAG TPA: 16S rRNA (adenine(1518)-N(6)/adenine(1519)-N(6))-dimethyltransferase RsmA [Actinomycetota bacterium]|nr:16S rRNA (adenine(1518)-N(6)/adenine(1519)-N(6))-dimethyltransferase RsmA [Actinomycetota bacterium]